MKKPIIKKIVVDRKHNRIYIDCINSNMQLRKNYTILFWYGVADDELNCTYNPNSDSSKVYILSTGIVKNSYIFFDNVMSIIENLYDTHNTKIAFLKEESGK